MKSDSSKRRRQPCKALKRVHVERPYTYRRKGNEEQAGFNRKVEDAIQEARLEMTGVSEASPALDRAKKALQRGLQVAESKVTQDHRSVGAWLGGGR